MEYLAIVAGIALFCILYPLAGTIRRREARKAMRDSFKTLNFFPTDTFSLDSAEIYADREAGLWFLRTDLRSSAVTLRPFSDLLDFDVRESGNLIAEARRGRPLDTVLFRTGANPRLPGTGRCLDLRVRLTLIHGEVYLSVLGGSVQRGSAEYKSALAKTRSLVLLLAEMQRSPLTDGTEAGRP
ncbi:MAG: hypothetical protein IJL69_00530 [Oscillospiraceae bacterium]|nr:hypothetical protein [Oscillospiraceae bacterium]